MADFQASKQRKSLVLEALFEILFRVLKHAAGGPARQQQQNGSAADGDSGVQSLGLNCRSLRCERLSDKLQVNMASCRARCHTI